MKLELTADSSIEVVVAFIAHGICLSHRMGMDAGGSVNMEDPRSEAYLENQEAVLAWINHADENRLIDVDNLTGEMLYVGRQLNGAGTKTFKALSDILKRLGIEE